MKFAFTLQRKKSSVDHMHGDIISPEGKWVCHTLEDEKREIKIYGETAISAGLYPIKIRPLGESRLDAPYEKRFNFYKGQLWLQDVPDFTYIYAHCGNNDDHTDGCLLLGLVRFATTIRHSRDAYRVFYPMVIRLMHAGHDVFINILDVPENEINDHEW